MKILSYLIAIILILGLTPIQPVSAADVGDLVSCPDISSVYYLASDGNRWVFPNEATFYTWYTDFDDIVEITCEELAGYSIGDLVTYRPGTRLVKIQSIPKVYAVEPGGVLRWIVTQNQAEDLYGVDWADRIDDIPDGFWSSYTEGNALPANEYATGTILRSAVSDRYFYVRSDDSLGGVNEARLDPIRESYAIEVPADYIDDLIGEEVGDEEWGQVEIPEQEAVVEDLTEDEEQQVVEAIEEAEAEDEAMDVELLEEEEEELVVDEEMEVEIAEVEEGPACWQQSCFSLGDLNGDCSLSAQDVLLLTNALNINETDSCYDVNQDGSVSPIDSLTLINNINLGVTCPAECVPQPVGLGEICGTGAEIECETGLICNTVSDDPEAEGICEEENTWHSRAVNVETDHPYANNASETFTITVVGAGEIKAYFSEFETETYYDTVWLTANPIMSWSGIREPFWTPAVSGDTISIELESDSFVNEQGFVINEVEYFR